MPKINVKGLDKDALLTSIFSVLPNTVFSTDKGRRDIASGVWGFDLKPEATEWDDKNFKFFYQNISLETIVAEFRSALEMAAKKSAASSSNSPSVSASSSSALPAVPTTPEKTEKKVDKETKQMVEHKKRADRDPFALYPNNSLRSYCAKRGFRIKSVHYVENSKSVNFIFHSEDDANKFKKQLASDLQEFCGRQKVDERYFDTAYYPPEILDNIFGAIVPYESDAINLIGKKLDLAKGVLQGPLEVKIPHIRMADANKFLYHIAKRISKGITDVELRESIQVLAEQILTLPAPPQNEDTKRLINSVADMVRFQESLNAQGYARVLIDNYDMFVSLIMPRIKTSMSGSELEACLRQGRFGVFLTEAILAELLLRQNSDLVAQVEFAPPVEIIANTMSLPLTLNIPEKLKNTLTTLIIDVSGSMGSSSGRLKELIQAMIEAVKQLAERPGQFLTLITFSTETKTKINKLPLNAVTLDGIIKTIATLETEQNTYPQQALEQAFTSFVEDSSLNHNIVLGTDGAFNAFSRVPLDAILKKSNTLPVLKMFAMDMTEQSPELDNLEILESMCGDGSQIECIPTKLIVTKVKNLILDKISGMLEDLQAAVIVPGETPQTVPMLCCSTNELVKRNVNFPKALYQAAINKKAPIQVKLQALLSDNTINTIEFTVSAELLQSNIGLKPTAKQKSEYVNDFFMTCLLERGIKRIVQLKGLDIDKRCKLIAEIQQRSKANNLPQDQPADAYMFVMSKLYTKRKAEMDLIRLPLEKHAKLQTFAEEARQYGFFPLIAKYKSDEVTLGGEVWVYNEMTMLAREALGSEYTAFAGGALVPMSQELEQKLPPDVLYQIYQTLLTKAKAEKKAPEIEKILLEKIDTVRVTGAIHYQAQIQSKRQFPQLSLDQQLAIIGQIRSVFEPDDAVNVDHKEMLARMMINRLIAVEVSKTLGDKKILASTCKELTIGQRLYTVKRAAKKPEPDPVMQQVAAFTPHLARLSATQLIVILKSLEKLAAHSADARISAALIATKSEALTLLQGDKPFTLADLEALKRNDLKGIQKLVGAAEGFAGGPGGTKNKGPRPRYRFQTKSGSVKGGVAEPEEIYVLVLTHCILGLVEPGYIRTLQTPDSGETLNISVSSVMPAAIADPAPSFAFPSFALSAPAAVLPGLSTDITAAPVAGPLLLSQAALGSISLAAHPAIDPLLASPSMADVGKTLGLNRTEAELAQDKEQATAFYFS